MEDGGSLAAIGSATKAFVLAHPVGMAAMGGVIVGMGAYYYLSKRSQKKAESNAAEATAGVAAA